MNKLPSNFTVLIKTNKAIANSISLDQFKTKLNNVISSEPPNQPIKFQFEDLEIQLGTFPTSKFLTHFPRGVYTSARTVSPGRVFDMLGHINRMHQGINGMKFDQDADMGLFNQLEHLKLSMIELGRLGLIIYNSLIQVDTEQRLKLSYHLTWDSQHKLPLLAFHCDNLLIPRVESCEAEAQIGQRTNPNTKDSKWVFERKSMEDIKRPCCNEVILLEEESGKLYEGISSNFFILIENDLGKLEVWSPPRKDVLIGTIMRLVEQMVNEDDHLTWIYKHPKLSDIRKWKGSFITSTSRLLLPIHTLYLNKDNDQQVVKFEEIHPEILKLKSKIFDYVIENSLNLENI